MFALIPQGTVYRAVFKAYLSSDGISPGLGKTITLVLSKNGGGFDNPSGGATTLTELAQGWYYADVSATDTGTLGPLILRATEGTIDPIESVYQVVNANNAGLQALPNAPAEALGGLYTRGGNLDTQLSTLASYVDTEVAAILAAVDTEIAAIKAQTDQLMFTVPGKVDAALQAASDLGTAVGNKIADMVLRRVAANIEASVDGDTPLSTASLYGLLMRVEQSSTVDSPGFHRIYRTNGTTVVGDVPLTVTPAAEGITEFGG